MKRDRNIFTLLAAWMIGFGLMIGLVFPFLAWGLGVSTEIALSPVFFMACMAAGILVGCVNILLTKFTVGAKLQLFTTKMNHSKEKILLVSKGGSMDDCNRQECHIPINSEDQFGICAIAFNQLMESFAAALQTQNTIRSYMEILSSQLELDTLATNALEVLMEHGKASAGAIFLVKDEQIQPIASYGIEDTSPLQNNHILLRAIKNQQHQIISYPEGLTVKSVLLEYQPRQVMILPIVYKSTALGVIVLATPQDFASELLREVDIFAHSLALSLNNSLEHEELQRMAEQDPLTDAYNRRSGLAIFKEAYDQAMKEAKPLSVLMMDIDFFKNINDTYGHLIGDVVLTLVTQRTKDLLRDTDCLIRYGGEEFMITLPNTETEVAQRIAERIRSMMIGEAFQVSGESIELSVSLGCGTLKPESATGDMAFLQEVDQALYQAKAQGRNRVVSI